MVNWPEPLNGGCYLWPTNPFVPFPKSALEQSLSDRFEQQVKLYPERIAIKNKGEAVSYRGLNSMANRVAQVLLQACGEGQEPIALLLENGEAVIAAILGVLKSGKVYVPLDPSLPQTRTEFILRDSQAKVILTNNRNLSLARELGDGKIQLINVDELESSLSARKCWLDDLTGRLRLHYLYLGFHRPAEGCDRDTSKPPSQRYEEHECPAYLRRGSSEPSSLDRCRRCGERCANRFTERRNPLSILH